MARKGRYSEESGFTLVELLTVIAIIGVLASTSVSSYSEYRKVAYHTLAKEMLYNARASLEAGKTEMDTFGTSTMVSFANLSNTLSGSAATITPGLQADKNMYIYVYHNPTCTAAAICLEDYITIRHCKTQLRTLWYRYSTGLEYKWEKLSSSSGC